jgi:hypothetical protein
MTALVALLSIATLPSSAITQGQALALRLKVEAWIAARAGGGKVPVPLVPVGLTMHSQLHQHSPVGSARSGGPMQRVRGLVPMIPRP